MSYETYFSIIITSFVAIVVGLFAIIFPIIYTKDTEKQQQRTKGSKKNRRKQNRRKPSRRETKETKSLFQKFIPILQKYDKVFIAFIILGILVFIATTFVYIKLKPLTYNETINKAEFEAENHNYLEAAKYYNEAAYVAYSNETKVSALYHEGACYLQLGLHSDDDKYFSQALRKYYIIIDNKKYKDAEYYQDALIDSSFALKELYDKWDDERLVNIINQLEKTYDFNNIEYISLKRVDLMNKVALAIAQYYNYATNENFYSPFGKYETPNRAITKELSDKAIFYYNVVCQLMPQADAIHFKNTDLLEMYYQISKLMVIGSICSENYMDAEANYTNTIKFCETAIETYEKSEKDSDELKRFFGLKISLGKSHYFWSMLDGEEHLSKAYEVLKPFLYLDINSDIERTLLDAGYYLILTTKCSEEEIDIILNRYEHQLEGLTIEDEDYLTLLQTTLKACESIVDIYEKNDRAVAKSEELSMKIENLMRVYY